MKRPVAALLVLALLSAGCEKLGLTRTTLPDMGQPLPVSVTLSFDPALTSAKFHYTDSCNHPNIPVFLGQVLESVLTDAADQTFKVVRVAGTKSGEAKSDLDVQIVLQQQGFKMLPDSMYDRVPAELMVEAVAVFRDPSGKVLNEVPLRVTHRDRLFVEVAQRRCAYITMDKFVHDTATDLATLFAKSSRDLLDPKGQFGSAGQQVASATPSALAFRATILDENSNTQLEAGERVKVRVDLTNSGKAPVTGVSVTLSGTPALVSHFPSPALQVGNLQPGESRSVEFAATLPQSLEAQRADVVVSVSAASGSSAPAAQTLVAMVREGARFGGRFEAVDQIPPAIAGFQRSHVYMLAVGISTYRDEQITARKYASLDAELVAAYFQALGGVPATNVRVLQDMKALRPDIEEALLDWLPRRMTSDSAVIVYFAGHAAVAPSGETFLVPYEGRQSSASRLYPFKDLEAALARLKTKQVLFIFDGGVLPLGSAAPSKRKAPRWGAGGSQVVHLIGTAGLRSGLEPEKFRHGLFTYFLLRGLKGEADVNFDGTVTLAELAAFLGRAVPAAARQEFNQDQRPLIFPAITPTSRLAGLTLTKPSSNVVSTAR